jgi:hypothetical protein
MFLMTKCFLQQRIRLLKIYLLKYHEFHFNHMNFQFKTILYFAGYIGIYTFSVCRSVQLDFKHKKLLNSVL